MIDQLPGSSIVQPSTGMAVVHIVQRKSTLSRQLEFARYSLVRCR